nr:MAG: ORF1 [Torque teno midi virus]
MPFWWKRRQRWRTNYKYRYRNRRRNRYRKPRRNIFRRRHRRAPRRRRRRRRTKVRKKKKFIKLLQWQPENIRKCKIKGVEVILLGANGKQFRNYTTSMNEWTPPTTPTGGGFATSKYSLAYLYEQFTLGNNIWTTSNCDFDLCRYTGCKFRFFRHPYIDFIATYQLEYPLTVNNLVYQQVHPIKQLLQKKKIIIPSLKTQPFGKRYITKKIKPPKQMTNKWFFQHAFNETGLLLLKTAACDFQFSHLGEYSENELTSFKCLNTRSFYTHGSWGANSTSNYYPVPTWGPPCDVQYTTQKNETKTYKLNTYAETVSYDRGWFSSGLLNAKSIQKPSGDLHPLLECRYNPKIDTGKQNAIYLLAVQTDKFTPPTHDKILIASGQPLWLLLFGWTDYIQKLRDKVNFLKTYYIVLQSPCLTASGSGPGELLPVIPVDESFINGRGPYNSTPYPSDTTNWFLCLMHQQKTINDIVKCGPFIPKPEGKRSNWELHANYTFFFKWGGSISTNKQVCNPADATEYPGPDPVGLTVQVSDPKSQIPESMLHIWDWRRHFITKKAFKRMSENLPAESTISTDADLSEPPQKRKKSKKEPSLQEKETPEVHYLQQLFEGDTYQEDKEVQKDPIQQLIQQQQLQQQHIKYNLLNLMTQMKHTQLQMQLQTGIL